MWFNRLVNFWQMYSVSGKSGFIFKKIMQMDLTRELYFRRSANRKRGLCIKSLNPF
jgi:hypothetical protein